VAYNERDRRPIRWFEHSEGLMPKAVVDPDDLHHFAIELRHFSEGVKERIGRINMQFGKLGETWQDQEHEKFAGEFQHTIRVLTKFIASAEEQVPILLRKAESIRRYLEQR
jgi:hypothetical protein